MMTYKNQSEILDVLLGVSYGIITGTSKTNSIDILDVGSGKTSITSIVNSCEVLGFKAKVDAIIHPDDSMKIKSVKNLHLPSYVHIHTEDMKDLKWEKQYDIVFAHLFLGFASSFNSSLNSYMALMSVFGIKSKIYVIMDYKENPDIAWDNIRMHLSAVRDHEYGKTVLLYNEFPLQKPVNFAQFTGKTVVSYIIASKK